MPATDDTPTVLDATLDATHTGDALSLALTVTNTGDSPVELSFRDGQRIDAVAERDGSEVWRYSEGRMFAMAVGSETLAPDESTTYEVEWPDPPTGEVDLRAWLTATDADASAETTVSVA
jgi:hypothetical protein